MRFDEGVYPVLRPVFEQFGQVALLMQGAELSMRQTLRQIISELEHPSTEDLENLTFGQLVTRTDILLGMRHADELADLRTYVQNRNYALHRFFLDLVRLLEDPAHVAKARDLLSALECDACLAFFRIESIAQASKIGPHDAGINSDVLHMMHIKDVDPARRIVVRRLG